MKNLNLSLLSLLLTVLVLSSCKKDKEIVTDKPSYDVPTTYSFESVNYSGQTTRIDMLSEIVTYCKTGNVMNTVLDAQKLKDMYANVNNQFTSSTLNSDSKNLKSKTISTEVATIEAYMDSIAEASVSTVSGSEGIAGVVTSGTSNRLCSGNGLEYVEMIEKGLMGTLLYYQITAVYLSEDKLGAHILKADRQHHWDEAFGYFGVPVDFPSNTTGLKFIGKYTNSRDAQLGCNAKLMNAFLLGRAAINNDDDATMNAQVAIIRDELERVFAATAISYLNKAKTGIADDNARNHTLSEGTGLIKALTFNPTKKITNAQIDEALLKLKTSNKYNFYQVSSSEMDEIKAILSSVYGFDSIKDVL